MKNRFEKSIEKLYTAFHNGTLDAMDCRHCAVGNLCDNIGLWMDEDSDFLSKNRIMKSFNNKTGYSSEELTNIEGLFLFGSTDKLRKEFSNTIKQLYVFNGIYTKEEQKELQFKGLCAVVKYLAELDNKPNPMDYTKLFEQVDNKPKYELSL